MTIKEWTVEKLVAYPVFRGRINVVKTVDWKLLGADGKHTAVCFGAVNIPYNAETPYTAYGNLTQAQIIEWVKAALGVDLVNSYELEISTIIEAKLTASLVPLRPPWE